MNYKNNNIILNKKTFEKVIEQDQSFFYFKFIGTEKKSNINYTQICILLDNCFNKLTSNNNTKQDISNIRTILKDFKEEYLEIQLNTTTTSKIIKYKNKELITYEKEEINNNEELNIKYKLGNLKITKIQNDVDLKRINNNENSNNDIKELQELINIKEVKLTPKDKALCLCYKLFYNEYPDFSTKDINMKMQIMLSILSNFDICIIDDYNFMLNKKNLPISYNLLKDINRLIPIGKIEKLDNTVILDKEVAKRVKIIGEEINTYIDNKDRLESLKLLSRIIHSSKCCLPTSTAIDTIAYTCDCTKNEVEASIKLVKTINKKF